MVEWFYGKEGRQYGPIDETTLRARIADGTVGLNDLIWSEGMTVWTPLSQLPQFGGGAALPPELPVLDDSVELGQGEEESSPYAPPLANLQGDYQAGPPLPTTNGCAIASLVCGILSLVFFCLCGGIFLGLPAVICGHLALNQLNGEGSGQEGRGMAIGGLVTGYCGLFIFLLLMVLG